MKKVLVIGAAGQLGVELVDGLSKRFGLDRVIASDIKSDEEVSFGTDYIALDGTDHEGVKKCIMDNGITEVYHLAAILSAKAESKPLASWDLNMKSLLSILEIAKEGLIEKVYWPSSIAVFGPDTPKDETPQNTTMSPNTVYGISKLAGERWCEYYHSKYGVDVRSLRYPGLIGYKAQPGGGTTDYAVEIFHKALQYEKFVCFLEKNATLPMMYMDDAVEATIQLMTAPKNNISVRSSYNVSAMSFSPEQLFSEIIKHIPDFQIDYEPDFRMDIARGWPRSIDDSMARKDWGWKNQYDLQKMVVDMLKHIPASVENH